MRAIKTFLWIQIALGLLGCFFALAAIHGGEMSKAWVYGLRVDHDKMKSSPDHHDAPVIRDQSLDRILDDFQASGQAQTGVAFYWLLTCAAFVVLAAVMLRFVAR